MSYAAVILLVVKYIFLKLMNKMEKDKKKQARKEAYLEKAKVGIDKRDASAITAYFDAARRL